MPTPGAESTRHEPPYRRSRGRPSGIGDTSGSALNNESVVTVLECGPHSFLFTADIEVAAQARLSRADSSLRVRVLKVPHHGASSSLYAPWFSQVRPETAVLSVGRYNPYGYPAGDLVED